MIDERLRLVDRVASILRRAAIVNGEAEAIVIVDALGDGDAAAREPRAIEMALERARGTPLAYVIGRVEFMGIGLAMEPGALVPREETELLGRTALSIIAERPGELRLIDMCCGSGNLVCALAFTQPLVRAWASDLTGAATAIARKNVERLGLDRRVTVLQGDLFAPFAELNLDGMIDMVVCNPPYISTGRLGKDRAELLVHEPREAFDGGAYGISIFQRVIRDALPFLKPGGTLLFEVGDGQARQVEALFARAGGYGPTRAVSDAAGAPRVLMAARVS